MRVSIWYRTEEQQPCQSGYYLSYRGWGMGGPPDVGNDNGYMYYDQKRNCWRDYKNMHTQDSAIVYYWTDADPHGWVESDPPSVVLQKTKPKNHVALDDAWQQVQSAIDRYKTIKALIE